MKSLQLIPKQYSSVHLRVKYPVENINEKTFTFQNHKDKIIHWATNAVNCAAELHPNSTIYVSSDNNDTIAQKTDMFVSLGSATKTYGGM